ncbi:hypothetical protein [Sphingomonas sp.]|jgi:hypothetical protein|uniref:hypothetical protein n=1 Tax=Sphingomonas sp. TaxID=28214 RepID=UPI002E34961C|nr:hypothetical protein [Sphingomonas sp.]HEX4695534.1 hypothetical protein [Sphingomonas sp.]
MTRVERDCLCAITRSTAANSLDVSARLIARRNWSSMLFTGMRLTLAVTAGDDEQFDHWLATLPEADFPISGHFVASAEVIARSECAASIELLVVEES